MSHSIAYVTALAAVYKALEIPVPFLPAPAASFEPSSILVSRPIPHAQLTLINIQGPRW